jgi:hypothetical protein
MEAETETETVADEEPRLTDEQRARLEEWLRVHPYGDQDANGIDLGSLRRNLRLTPTERLIRLEEAANELLELKRAAECPQDLPQIMTIEALKRLKEEPDKEH